MRLAQLLDWFWLVSYKNTLTVHRYIFYEGIQSKYDSYIKGYDGPVRFNANVRIATLPQDILLSVLWSGLKYLLPDTFQQGSQIFPNVGLYHILRTTSLECKL